MNCEDSLHEKGRYGLNKGVSEKLLAVIEADSACTASTTTVNDCRTHCSDVRFGDCNIGLRNSYAPLKSGFGCNVRNIFHNSSDVYKKFILCVRSMVSSGRATRLCR